MDHRSNKTFAIAIALVLTVVLCCAFVFAYIRVFRSTEEELISATEDKITLISENTSAFLQKAKTANAFDEDKQNAFAAGMNGHIAKPIDIPKLLDTLTEILKQRGY